jgi:hypothetical protein
VTLDSTTSRLAYLGAGSVGPYTIPFRVMAAGDLIVVQRSVAGAETVLELTTDYTVTGVGNATAALTLTTALPVDAILSIRRAPAMLQPTSLQNQGAYYPKSVEDALDRLAMELQSVQDQVDRSLGVPESYPLGPSTLRVPPETGKVLAWQSPTQLGNSTLDSSAVALPGEGRTVATLSAYLFNNRVYNARDYGAVGDGVTDDTAAIQAAMVAADAVGGGTVYLPAGTYRVSELTFDGMSNVRLVGASNAYNYDGSHIGASALLVTDGVWAVRLPPTSHYCGLHDLVINGQGTLSGALPHAALVDGVEYGVLIETGATSMTGVTILGFMYGCVIAAGGNANVFYECAFVFNTRCGFAVTASSANAYAAYHPNLVRPTDAVASTVFTVKNCNIRRNGWGIILRGGRGLFSDLVVESNYFGGLFEYVGTLDDEVLGSWYDCHFEGNWSDFDLAANYTIVQNRLLQETLGNWVPWTLSHVDTALSDAGYEMFFGSVNTGTGDPQPAAQSFFDLQMHPAGGATASKAMYVKQALRLKFVGGGSSGGDTAHGIRLGAGANAIHFWDFDAVAPASWGNRCAWMVTERSATDGILGVAGLSFENGYFRKLFGAVKFPSVEDLSADPYTFDAYEEYASPGGASTGAITANGSFKLTKTGNKVTLVVAALAGNAAAQPYFQLADLVPARFRPAATVAIGVPVKDNGVATGPGVIFVTAAGEVQIYRAMNETTNFTNAASAGLLYAVSISWTI